MADKKKDPVALAGAYRVRIIIAQPSKYDCREFSPTAFDLQVRKVLALAPVSPSLAAVVAEHAFSAGRHP